MTKKLLVLGRDAAADPLDTELDAYGRRAGRRRRKTGPAEVLGYTAVAGGLAFAGGDAMGAIQHFSTHISASQTGYGYRALASDINDDGSVDGLVWAQFISGAAWGGLVDGTYLGFPGGARFLRSPVPLFASSVVSAAGTYWG
jgi:hypothetical protein